MIALNVQYCDNIIRHEGGFSYRHKQRKTETKSIKKR